MFTQPPMSTRHRSLRGLAMLALASAAFPLSGESTKAHAQPPVGQSARLFGVHDWTGSSVAYLEGATDSCDKGWLTHLTYIDGDAATLSPPEGISVIARLDWNGSESVPPDAGTRASYVARFVESVRRSPDVHVWIVGNEPNFTISGPWPGSHEGFIAPYVAPFVEAYGDIRPMVHALPGHADDAVLLPAPSPWSPCFLEGLARIVRGIDAASVPIDGFAIHPGTRAPSDSQRADRVTAVEAFHSCDIAPYTDGSGQFGVLEDFARVIDAEGHAGAPLFITESAHNTDQGGVVNHVDEDRGFFDAIYGAVASFNDANGGRVRALTPYRWTTNGDGSGRDHSIENKPSLQADHRRGVDVTWTTVSCDVPPPTGCRDDSACSLTERCEGSSCVAAGACPCAESEVCRRDGNVCVPANSGIATIQFAPAAPEAGQTVRVDVFATVGWTNVGLAVEGPLPGGAPTATFVGVEGSYHWLYDVTLPADGSYRFFFTADPGGSTLYARAYLNVGPEPAVGTDGGVGVDAGSPSDAGDGMRDAAAPGPGLDAGSGRGSVGGCGCHAIAVRGMNPSVAAFALFALVLLRRRRARRGGPPTDGPQTVSSIER